MDASLVSRIFPAIKKVYERTCGSYIQKDDVMSKGGVCGEHGRGAGRDGAGAGRGLGGDGGGYGVRGGNGKIDDDDYTMSDERDMKTSRSLNPDGRMNTGIAA